MSRCCAWITTSRSSRPNPADCPERPHWRKPRLAGCSPPATRGYWDAARRARGDAKGTRAVIAILLAHRTMAAAALITAMDRAVASGCLNPETVIIDARRHTSALAPAVPIVGLARYERPPPSLTDYDDLLTGSES